MICSDIIPDYVWEDIPYDDNDNEASASFSNGNYDSINGHVMLVLIMIVMMIVMIMIIMIRKWIL